MQILQNLELITPIVAGAPPTIFSINQAGMVLRNAGIWFKCRNI